MWTVSFLLLVLVVGAETLVCRIGEQPCGSNNCFDPTIHRCIDENGTVECLNSCNGTCYPNSQYCHDNTKICNNYELVCDVKYYGYFTLRSLGLVCYNPSYYTCHNNTLCQNEYTCGTKCLVDYYAACVNNQTICYGFAYNSDASKYLNLCGPQQQCYRNTTSVCLNGNIVCAGLNAQLCGTTCFNPDVQDCIDDTVQCKNSCNGTCYSSSQYCYNNAIICRNEELVCDVKSTTSSGLSSTELVCYDPSQNTCYNNTLCYVLFQCGRQCALPYQSVCVNNEIACPVTSDQFEPESSAETRMKVCGPQKQCYDSKTSICVSGTTVCSHSDTQLCGTGCYNPNTQICVNGTAQCQNSCNGICYSNSQYCYNNTLICNNTELVCDIKTASYFFYRPPWESSGVPYGLTCYDPSLLNCYNNSICYDAQVCGTECIIDQYSICLNNQAICNPEYYPRSAIINICGPQQQCYDSTTSVCLNETTVCEGLNAQLCGTTCFNPDLQDCIDDIVQCKNSCNGICYLSPQYCYNNEKICNIDELVCDVKKAGSFFSGASLGLNCYNPSQRSCSNGTLCYKEHLCGSQCLVDGYSACVKNETICSGFYYYYYHGPGARRYLDVCGSQKLCYDNSTHICLGENGVLCPIGSQLCSGVCYNPQLEYCTLEDSTTDHPSSGTNGD